MTLTTNAMTGMSGLPRGAASSASQWKRGGGPNDVIPRDYRLGQIEQFSPEQKQQFGSLFSQVGPDSYLSKLAGGDQGTFEEMEAPAHRQLQEILSGIANRFSNAGSGGRRSGGFQRATSSAASNFAQDLQARRGEIRRNALNDLMGFSESLLRQRPTEKFLTEKQKKTTPYGSLLGTAGGAGLGFLAGGPAGALTGASIGNSFGSKF